MGTFASLISIVEGWFGIWEAVPIFANEHPYWSTAIVVLFILIFLYVFASTAIKITGELKKLLAWLRSLPSLSWGSLSWGRIVAGIVLWVVIGTLTIGFFLSFAFSIVNKVAETTIPVPSLKVGKEVFVGEPIALSLNFDKQGNDQPTVFEIESAKDKTFHDDLIKEWTGDSEIAQINRKINGARYWHVCVLKAGTRFGRCSDHVLISQYENAISRITSTCQMTIYVANTYEQGIFRFIKEGSDKNFTGFDTKLASHIASKIIEKLKLSDTCGRTVDHPTKIVPVAWSDLFDNLSKGSADMAISAITRTKEREEHFRIRFSNPYYCTSQAIMWVGKRETHPLKKIMPGKRIGVPEKTTSENFVNYLSTKLGKKLFEVKKYKDVPAIISALTSSEIDYGIADELFAKSARMRLHKAVETDFNFRKLNRDDYPAVDEEYAVAVSAREDKLLNYINEIIAEMGDKGLERLYSEFVQEYYINEIIAEMGDKGLSSESVQEYSKRLSGEAGETNARTSNRDDFRASCK